MKKILKKFLIVLFLLITLIPNISYGFGGVLLEPITDFAIAIGDAVIITVQKIFLPGEEDAVIYEQEADPEEDDLTWFESFMDVYVEIPIISHISKWTADLVYGEGTWNETTSYLKTYGVGNMKYGPATIFSGKIELFNIDFIYQTNTIGSKAQLREIISTMYIILRNIVIVFFMVTLVYIGIKIVLSSTSSQDKAKYKEMLKDWFIGLLLIFTLHIIMVAIIVISDKIVGMFTGLLVADSGQDVLFCIIRNKVSIASSTQRIAYTIMYLVMCMYTIMFTIQYLKRLIYVMFLTIFAPFVALTYPIDKMRDGKAQALGMWFKEYLYNTSIQIIHIILYYVLIETAIELATNNAIYALVAIGFMIEAEKILKMMFGFEAKGGIFGGKSSAALAGALAMGAIGKIGKRGIKKENGIPKNNNENSNENNKIRTKDSGNSINSLLKGNESENSSDSKEENIENFNDYKDQNAEINSDTEENKDEVLEKYKNDGFKKNANGEYFNPWTSEYDSEYDPHNDKSYANNEKNTKNSKKKKIKILKIPKPIRGAMAVGGHFAGKGIRTAIKTGIKLTGAGTLGMVGVAAGLASDDFSNVLKYGAAGIGAGWVTGEKAIQAPGNVSRAFERVKQEAKDVYRNKVSPYEDTGINKELDKKWKQDKENDKLYAAKLNISLKEAKRVKKEYARKYRQYGISNDKTIIKAMKLDANKYGDMASNDRIVIANFAEKIKTSKEYEDLERRFMKQAKNESDKTRFKNILDAVREINDLV